MNLNSVLILVFISRHIFAKGCTSWGCDAWPQQDENVVRFLFHIFQLFEACEHCMTLSVLHPSWTDTGNNFIIVNQSPQVKNNNCLVFQYRFTSHSTQKSSEATTERENHQQFNKSFFSFHFSVLVSLPHVLIPWAMLHVARYPLRLPRRTAITHGFKILHSHLQKISEVDPTWQPCSSSNTVTCLSQWSGYCSLCQFHTLQQPSLFVSH